MKTISFTSDQKLSKLLDLIAEAELMNRSLLVRSILFDYAKRNHLDLVEFIYD